MANWRQWRRVGLGLLAVVSLNVTLWLSNPVIAQTASGLFQAGVAAYQVRDFDTALTHWHQALTQYQAAQDPLNQSRVLTAIAAAYLDLANYEAAQTYANAALELAQISENLTAQAQALGNLGNAQRGLGQLLQAVDSYQQTLHLMEQMENAVGAAQTWGLLGNIWEALGDYDQAIAAHQRNLDLARELQHSGLEVIALGNLGATTATAGNIPEAIDHYQASLALATEIGDALGQAYTLQNLGAAYHHQQNLTAALDAYQQSLALARRLNHRTLEAQALSSVGVAYDDLNDLPTALDYHQQSLALAQAINSPRLVAVVRNNLAHTLLESGKLAEAEHYLRDAIASLDRLRPTTSDSYNISVFDTQVYTYNLLQQVLVAQGNYGSALEVAEQGRARPLGDLLSAQLPPAQPIDLTQIRQIAQQHQATLLEYTLIPDDLFRVQGKQQGTVAEIYIWVVQPTGELHFRQVDLTTPDDSTTPDSEGGNLEDWVRQGRQALGWSGLFRNQATALPVAPTQSPGRARVELQRLYQLLIEPITPWLPDDPNALVMIIPQGSLFLVPFAALQDPQQHFLIDHHSLAFSPAIGLLDLVASRRQQRPAPGSQAVVMGNPIMPVVPGSGSPDPLVPLPGAEAEAIAIAALLNTQAITGPAATLSHLLPQFNQAATIHLATHGLLDYRPPDANPGLSLPGAIALTPEPNFNGLLTAADLANLSLQADLVVLSACDTGLGDITGDGVVGLSRSLLVAGANSTLVSLWAVPDRATADLMERFYQSLSQGEAKAPALRQAMLTTRESYPNPLDWAGFSLVGLPD